MNSFMFTDSFLSSNTRPPFFVGVSILPPNAAIGLSVGLPLTYLMMIRDDKIVTLVGLTVMTKPICYVLPSHQHSFSFCMGALMYLPLLNQKLVYPCASLWGTLSTDANNVSCPTVRSHRAASCESRYPQSESQFGISGM